MMAHGLKSSLDVAAGVEVVPDVERRNYERKPPAEPKLAKVAAAKLNPVTGCAG